MLSVVLQRKHVSPLCSDMDISPLQMSIASSIYPGEMKWSFQACVNRTICSSLRYRLLTDEVIVISSVARPVHGRILFRSYKHVFDGVHTVAGEPGFLTEAKGAVRSVEWYQKAGNEIPGLLVCQKLKMKRLPNTFMRVGSAGGSVEDY